MIEPRDDRIGHAISRCTAGYPTIDQRAPA
jgi:hypothetical protein